MQKAMEYYKFLITRRDKTPLKYVSEKKGNKITVVERNSFLISIPSRSERNVFLILEKFINKRFISINFGRDIKVSDFRYMKHEDVKSNKKLIDRDNYIELKQHKRKNIHEGKEVQGKSYVEHKVFGRIYFINKEDKVRSLNKPVEFLIPTEDNKFKQSKLLYSKTYFKIKR